MVLVQAEASLVQDTENVNTESVFAVRNGHGMTARNESLELLWANSNKRECYVISHSLLMELSMQLVQMHPKVAVRNIVLPKEEFLRTTINVTFALPWEHVQATRSVRSSEKYTSSLAPLN